MNVMLFIGLLLVAMFGVLAVLIRHVLRKGERQSQQQLIQQEGDSSGNAESDCADEVENRENNKSDVCDCKTAVIAKIDFFLYVCGFNHFFCLKIFFSATVDGDDKNLKPEEFTTNDQVTTHKKGDKMSTNEGETRPSFLVGDQDEPESPVGGLNNGNQDEDRDHFNQNMSQKPSGFDLAEKRKRLR